MERLRAEFRHGKVADCLSLDRFTICAVDALSFVTDLKGNASHVQSHTLTFKSTEYRTSTSVGDN
jgi:hypothetical protein